MSKTATSQNAALIFGDTGLLGSNLAEHLVELGWTVVGVSRSGPPQDINWSHYIANASDQDSLRELVHTIRDQSVTFDLVVFAIGSECDLENFLNPGGCAQLKDTVIGVLVAPLLALSMILPLIRQDSLVVFFSGGGALAAPPRGWNVTYGAAKAGLHRAVETLAMQLRSVRVWPIILDPGWIPDPTQDLTFEDGADIQFGILQDQIRRPEDATQAILAAFVHRGECVAGRLVSACRDFQADLAVLTNGASAEFLRLRLVEDPVARPIN